MKDIAYGIVFILFSLVWVCFTFNIPSESAEKLFLLTMSIYILIIVCSLLFGLLAFLIELLMERKEK
ncbi:putative membrane protein [Paenibacillus phage vB_PlaP_API480]|nr:putative membrane protein [Paenibacillus phage vB_PlaP_API480]